MVADGHLVGVTPKILHHWLRRTKWPLGIDNRIGAPTSFSQKEILWVVFLTPISPQNIYIFCAEYFTQCLHCKQKLTIGSQVLPIALGIQTSAWNDAMQVRMQTQILPASTVRPKYAAPKSCPSACTYFYQTLPMFAKTKQTKHHTLLWVVLRPAHWVQLARWTPRENRVPVINQPPVPVSILLVCGLGILDNGDCGNYYSWCS